MSPRGNVISSRRKSCFACARGKRRCDLGFPQCDRCLARRVTCEYAWISPQEAQEMAQGVNHGSRMPQDVRNGGLDQCGPTETPQWSLEPPAPGQSRVDDTATSGSLTTTPLTMAPALVPLLDEIIGRGRTWTFHTPDLQFQSSNKSWLNSDLFVPQPPPNTGTSTTPLQIASASSTITSSILQARVVYMASRQVLQVTALAEQGQTAFIHHSHVDTSPILREALATCALYTMRNSANLSVIRSEIARRAALLVEATETAISLTLPSSHRAKMLDLLPAVQAMLIYQCMRLFSTTDDEQQTQAVRDAESLARWIDILEGDTQWPRNNGSDGAKLQFSGWKDWVQAESLRRTMVFAELLDSTYTYLRFGWYRGSEKLAKLCFTGQAALWEARSAAEWDQARWQRLWFEINMSNFQADTKSALPDDLDELGIIIRLSYDGFDALKEWLRNDKRLLEKWGLSSSNSCGLSSF